MKAILILSILLITIGLVMLGLGICLALFHFNRKYIFLFFAACFPPSYFNSPFFFEKNRGCLGIQRRQRFSINGELSVVLCLAIVFSSPSFAKKIYFICFQFGIRRSLLPMVGVFLFPGSF